MISRLKNGEHKRKPNKFTTKHNRLNGDMATNYLKYIKLNWWEISLPSNSFHRHHSIKQQGASVKI